MRFKIQTQLIAVGALVALLIVVGTIVGGLAAANMQRRVHQVVDEAFPAVVACEALRSGVNQTFAALRGFIILGADPADAKRFETRLERAWKTVDREMESLMREEFKNVWLLESDRDRLDWIEKKLAELRRVQQQIKDGAHAEHNVPAQFVLRQQVEPLALEMNQLLTKIIREEGLLEATLKRKEFLKVISDLRGSLSVLRASLRTFVSTGDKELPARIQAQLATYQDAYASAFRVLRRMTKEQRENWDRFDTLHEAYVKHPAEVVKLRSDKAWNVSHYRLKETAVPLADSIRAQVNSLKSAGVTRARGLEKELAAASSSLTITLVTVAILTVVLGGGSTYMMARQLLTTVRQAVTTVATTSERMSQSATHQQQTAQHQLQAVNELVATMEQLMRSADSSASQAGQALDETRRVKELATRGTETVDQSLSGMRALEQRVDDAAREISELSEHNGKISSMTAMVRDLAKKTNVLALNASVEAAQAGEQGVGFTVVAEAIRNLADDSAAYGKEIQARVERIESSTNSTVLAIDEGTKKVKSGKRLAEETTRSFHHVADSIESAVDDIQQISMNAKEQAEALNHVGHAMERLNQAARENDAHARAARQAIDRLESAVSGLKAIV